jgi:hypothetical protein
MYMRGFPFIVAGPRYAHLYPILLMMYVKPARREEGSSR